MDFNKAKEYFIELGNINRTKNWDVNNFIHASQEMTDWMYSYLKGLDVKKDQDKIKEVIQFVHDTRKNGLYHSTSHHCFRVFVNVPGANKDINLARFAIELNPREIFNSEFSKEIKTNKELVLLALRLGKGDVASYYSKFFKPVKQDLDILVEALKYSPTPLASSKTCTLVDTTKHRDLVLESVTKFEQGIVFIPKWASEDIEVRQTAIEAYKHLKSKYDYQIFDGSQLGAYVRKSAHLLDTLKIDPEFNKLKYEYQQHWFVIKELADIQKQYKINLVEKTGDIIEGRKLMEKTVLFADELSRTLNLKDLDQPFKLNTTQQKLNKVKKL